MPCNRFFMILLRWKQKGKARKIPQDSKQKQKYNRPQKENTVQDTPLFQGFGVPKKFHSCHP